MHYFALAFRMVFQNKGYDLYIRLIIILDTIVRKSSSNFSKLLNKCFMIKIYMYVEKVSRGFLYPTSS